MRKKLTAALLALALVLSLAPAALAAGMDTFRPATTYDGRFTDISGWAESYIIAAYESGLVKGTSKTTYSPNSAVRVSEVVTLAARIHRLYEEGTAAFPQSDPWYAAYYDYCVDNGILTGDMTGWTMSFPATRRQVLQILNATLPAYEFPALNQVEDGIIPDVPDDDPDAEAIYRFYRAGVLSGDSAHRFNPSADIRRNELAAFITRLTGLSDRMRFTLTAATVYANRRDALVVDGKGYWIGMPAARLTAAAGSPDQTVDSLYGFRWYCWYDDDYDTLLLAGVGNDGLVQALASGGNGLSYCGMEAGDAAAITSGTYDTPAGRVYAQVLTDKNDGGAVHGVYLRKSGLEIIPSAAGMAGESYVNFHMVNAFRRWHGEAPLVWSSRAAEAARKYSLVMLNNNHFDHTGPDGSDPGTRVSAEGVRWYICGENIATAYYMSLDGIEAYDGWVNSAGHRRNMLESRFTYLGVGGACDSSRFYWTQDFYS